MIFFPNKSFGVFQTYSSKDKIANMMVAANWISTLINNFLLTAGKSYCNHNAENVIMIKGGGIHGSNPNPAD